MVQCRTDELLGNIYLFVDKTWEVMIPFSSLTRFAQIQENLLESKILTATGS